MVNDSYIIDLLVGCKITIFLTNNGYDSSSLTFYGYNLILELWEIVWKCWGERVYLQTVC